MSILDKLFRRDREDELEKIPNVPVGRDWASPNSCGDMRDTIYSDDVVGYITTELERRRDERTGLELQWTLNSNFLTGHQNCDINMLTHSIRDEDNVLVTDKERRVYNRIAPLMETRHANLKSIDYDMIVTPRTAELEDYENMDEDGNVPVKRIELDSRLTPSANAQRYYKKYNK